MRHFIAIVILGTFSLIACTEPAPQLTESQTSQAIRSIKGYPEVLDAAIKQRGRYLSLVLVVPHRTKESRAKQLGDNFVRLVKTFGPEERPGREIGRGQYDYLVGVYTPGEKKIVLGAKVGPSPVITWE